MYMYTNRAEAYRKFNSWKKCLKPGATLVLAVDHIGAGIHYNVMEYSPKERDELDRLLWDEDFDIIEVAKG